MNPKSNLRMRNGKGDELVFTKLLAASSTFQKRRKVFLFAFIVNCVVFGIVSAISAGLSFPELVDSYPLGTTFVWSMFLATLLLFDWKQMFYWNLVPLLLNIGYALLNAGYEKGESEIEIVEGGWELQAITAIFIVIAFFFVGVVMQVIVVLKNRKDLSAVTQHNRIVDSDDEEDYEIEELNEEYVHEEFKPIDKDDPRWS